MASSYALKIALTRAQLEGFYESKSRIAVAKSSEGDDARVIWQALRPIQFIEMTWEEHYGIYASETEASHGAVIESLAWQDDAAKGKRYTLEPSGIFSVPEAAKSAHSYYAKNLFSEPNQTLLMGLYQAATLGGVLLPGKPISYASIPRAGEAMMTPYTNIYVWLESEVLGGTVVTEITNPRTKVKFGGGLSDVELEYNSADGEFVIKDSKAASGAA